MTIQIDDAGWGCLLGGTIIGAYRIETQEFAWAEVPAALFQGEAFARKDYLDSAAEAASRLLAQLDVSKDEPVEVCTGFVLTAVHDYLAQNGYHWKTTKITGPLQQFIETTLLNRLRELGLNDLDYETLTTKQGLLFWKCLRWLKGGDINAAHALPDRERFAKTGWANYQTWATRPYEEAKRLAGQSKAGRKKARW